MYPSTAETLGMPPKSLSKEDKVQKILSRHEKMKAEKEPWINTYRLVGEYVMSRKQNFNQDLQQGQILTGQIFDGTAPQANQLMAASLLGALYPNGPRSFRIDPPDTMPTEESGSDEVKNWYDRSTKRMASVMDNYKSGLLTALTECIQDQGAFGISGVGVFEDYDDDVLPVNYVPYDCKKMCIAEAANGSVDTVYIEKEVTVKQLIQEFGWNKVSKESRDKYEAGNSEDKVKVLHAIEPRIKGAPQCFGTKGMPFASIHIEMMTRHQLKESGYWEMPIMVTRFWKAMGEKYGRSPAMEAIPDILEVNLFREATIVATEKMLNPPLVVNDPDVLSGGRVRTYAGAQNVRKMGGRTQEANSRPAVEPIITIQEIQSTYERIKELVKQIQTAFFIDRLTDLSGGDRMTIEEVQTRNKLRGQSLATVYARLIAELFTPLIERTFTILINRGFFGVMPGSDEHNELIGRQAMGEKVIIDLIPDAIAEKIMMDQEAYKVTYIAPAVRVMQAEELDGINGLTMFAGGLAQINPAALDNIDFDECIRLVRGLQGAPATVVRSMEAVQKLRDQRAEANAAQNQLMTEQMQSETARNVGQAVQSITGKAQARAA